MKALLVLGLVGLFALGCDDNTKKPSAAPATGATTAASSAAAPAPAEAANQVPAEEDYEPKAEAAITTANVDAEVTKLQKEIAP